jgi:hypothetical protein
MISSTLYLKTTLNRNLLSDVPNLSYVNTSTRFFCLDVYFLKKVKQRNLLGYL